MKDKNGFVATSDLVAQSTLPISSSFETAAGRSKEPQQCRHLRSAQGLKLAQRIKL
jgi:hypothetical protein